MSCGRHSCDWMTCTLCRSGRQSLSTLHRASRRSVDFPVSQQQPPCEQQVCNVYNLYAIPMLI